VQTDGKILIGGAFTSYSETMRSYIARLNADGSPDAAFLSSGTGPSDAVYAVAVQTDGRILIGGSFTSYNGATRNRVARLNADGSLDATFLSTGTGASLDVSEVAVQTDGKILIGGSFASYNGTTRNAVARLNANGSLDTTFLSSGTGPSGGVQSVVVQTDGKILIGGYFTTYSGTTRDYVARLAVDGSLDTTFLSSGTGADTYLHAVAMQSDGKILIGGEFTSYNGTTRNRLARLNADGSLDTSFLSSGTGADGQVHVIAVQTDGRILIGGQFSSYNSIARGSIARIRGAQ
jgi:uncharacterized delta-60 repeat protein